MTHEPVRPYWTIHYAPRIQLNCIIAVLPLAQVVYRQLTRYFKANTVVNLVYSKSMACPEVEPGASHTQSENHATRLTSLSYVMVELSRYLYNFVCKINQPLIQKTCKYFTAWNIIVQKFWLNNCGLLV